MLTHIFNKKCLDDNIKKTAINVIYIIYYGISSAILKRRYSMNPFTIFLMLTLKKTWIMEKVPYPVLSKFPSGIF